MKLYFSFLVIFGSVTLFAELSTKRTENVLGSEVQIFRNGTHLLTTRYNLDGSPFSQTVYFNQKTVITVQFDRYGRFQYRMVHGHDGIKTYITTEDSLNRISISIPNEKKVEAFYVQKNGLLDPVEDRVLNDYGFIDLNGECLGPKE